MTTETAGLWVSEDASATSPHFTQVTTYPFRHPTRVFYNPYKPTNIWVASFGNGMRMGITGSSNGVLPVTRDALRVRIYPNPSSGLIHLDFMGEANGRMSLQLFDLPGKNVAILRLTNAVSQEAWLRGLRSGIYFYILQKDDTILQKGKLVISQD
jgi:hypothetical protein